MSDIRVASRYAKSLIDLGEEKGSLEDIRQDMLLFSKTAKENREFQLLLKNPIINHEKKLAVLKAIFGGKVSPITDAFFRIITSKNRESVLEAVSNEFEFQYNVKKGIQAASVTTASPLTPELRKELTELVTARTGKTIQLEEKVDPALIGGFVLNIGDTQIDDSVKSTLQRLRNKFNENAYIPKL